MIYTTPPLPLHLQLQLQLPLQHATATTTSTNTTTIEYTTLYYSNTTATLHNTHVDLHDATLHCSALHCATATRHYNYNYIMLHHSTSSSCG